MTAGVLMGWLCVPYQSHPYARVGTHGYRSFLSSYICSIFNGEFSVG